MPYAPQPEQNTVPLLWRVSVVRSIPLFHHLSKPKNTGTSGASIMASCQQVHGSEAHQTRTSRCTGFVNKNWSLHLHLPKVSRSLNCVQTSSTKLSPSPVCQGVHRLPLWSAQPHILPLSPPVLLLPPLMTPLPPVLSLPLLLPLSLCVALSLPRLFLPVDGSSGKKTKRLVPDINAPLCESAALERGELWSTLHLGK